MISQECHGTTFILLFMGQRPEMWPGILFSDGMPQKFNFLKLFLIILFLDRKTQRQQCLSLSRSKIIQFRSSAKNIL